MVPAPRTRYRSAPAVPSAPAVLLEAGPNTIEAGNTTGRWRPDLDRITVAPR